MSNTSSILQLLSIVIAIALVVAFILPKFEDIRMLQDDIALFDEQSKNIEQINAQLQSLVASVNSTSAANQNALIEFLPDTVDTILILRTLENIVNLAGVQAQDLKYEESNEVEGRNIESHTFAFTIGGSYEEISNYFALLEQNKYLFEVSEVEISVGEFGELLATGKLVTYSFLRNGDLTSNNVR